jgi:AraC-like DNA-binding protein
VTFERARLQGSLVGLVEDLRVAAQLDGHGSEGFSAEFQVCFPYRGLFVWHVNDEDVVGDPNQVLFVTGGEPYRLSASCADGYAELIITPEPDVLEELVAEPGRRLARHPLFQRRSRRADLTVQRLRACFLHRTVSEDFDDLSADEHALGLLRAALDVPLASHEPGSRTRRLIRRTKEFLEANVSASVRLRDVARSVGASPAYLTDVFRRVEGVPVHRYVIQLRLSRALVELPHANDLTALAFDLGFSSHSHFTVSFRRAFGCTPSQFREKYHSRVHARPARQSPGACS